jgi:sugar/nucleoside kinase (ribokinase family)
MTVPEFVVVGHVCQDILPGGGLGLGGSVSYAATAALQMGCRVGVVTSAGPGLELTDTLPDAQIVCHRSESTTIFENIYHNGKRTQYLHQRADVITGDHIPVAWRSAPMVYLGSIDQEIDAGVFHCFSPDSLICVMPQGFFRRWDERGLVSFIEWTPPEDVLRRIDVLVISELDVPDPEQQVREWQDLVKVMVVTRADRGATVYRAGECCHHPARLTQQVDPTGAGDVFAAAYLIRYSETRDACESACFANAAASFSIEQPGVLGIPTRDQVEAYLEASGG